MSRAQNTVSKFDERAAWYDSRYDARGADRHALRARVAAVLDLVGPGPGDALDAGMGPGRLCEALLDAGWRVTGVDASTEMVALAASRLGAHTQRLVRAEIDSMPFEDASFDVVVATGVLEYSGPSAIPELVRVLRPGGKLVVSYPNPQAWYGIWKTHAFYPAVRALRGLARSNASASPRGSAPLVPARLRELIAAANVELVTVRPTSYLALPSPLDSFAPAIAEALGRRLETASPRFGKRLATQVVYAGRKR